MRNKLWSQVIAALALLAIGALPIRANAQNVSDQMVPSLELEQADIRDALKLLFKNVGANYSVAQDVQGTVTVSLHNVPFETALQNLLKQVDATYRVEAGVFNIVKKEQEVVPITPAGQEGLGPQVAPHLRLVRIHILHADPMLIYDLLRGQFHIGGAPEVSAGVGGGFGGSGGGGNGGGGAGGGAGSGGGGVHP